VQEPREPSGIKAPLAPLSAGHPTVEWVRREVLPLIRETFAPERVDVFDPPDRPAGADDHAPGLLIVSQRFSGISIPERMGLVRGLLASTSPVRPLCLTPEEFAVSKAVPGPVLAAARTGIRLI